MVPSPAPQLLLAARADFHRAGPGRMTALCGAAAWASAETVKAILDAGPLGEVGDRRSLRMDQCIIEA